jgi:hypothetical protein
MKRLPRINPAQQEELMSRLPVLIESGSFGIRAAAIETVGLRRLTEFSFTLTQILDATDEHPAHRAAAAFSLTLIGDPSTFDVLVRNCQAAGDVGRWATRGCFALLGRVGYEYWTHFLSAVDLSFDVRMERLVEVAQCDLGSPSERLAKALLLERLILRQWDAAELEILGLMLYSIRIRDRAKRWSDTDTTFLTACADALAVHKGDLKKSFLSRNFILRWEKHGWCPGIDTLVQDAWERICRNPQAALQRLSQIERAAALARFLKRQGVLQPDQPTE